MVTGCGGGSGGGDDAGSSAVKKVTGKVVRSGIQPNTDLDKVCYDKNSNKACDKGEPVASVSDDGSYTIESSEDDAAKYSLVAELYGDKSSASSKILAKVKANGTEQKPTTIFETPVGKSTISSITTVIKTKMDMGALSLAEAEQQTKKELFNIEAGTEEDADTDLFSASPSDKITAAAKKVATAMESLLKTFEDKEVAVNMKTLLFLMNTIVEQLEKIQQNQNVVLGKDNKQDIEKAADDADSTKPTVQTAAQAFKGEGILGYDARFEGDTPKPYFQLYKFTTTKIAAPAGDPEEWGIPAANSDLEDIYSAEVKGDNVIFTAKDNKSGNRNLIVTGVETVKLSGKTLRPAASYEGGNTDGIEFSDNSAVDKIRLLFPDEQKVFEKDLKVVMDECYGKDKRADYWCTDVNLDNDSNPTKISDGFGNVKRFEIIMRTDDNTYFIKPLTDQTRYSDEGGLFSERRPTRKGKYEKSGDDYIFKDDEGKVVFKVFKKQNQNDNSNSYIVAGHLFDDVHQVMYLFNEAAAQQIKEQKNKFELPSE